MLAVQVVASTSQSCQTSRPSVPPGGPTRTALGPSVTEVVQQLKTAWTAGSEQLHLVALEQADAGWAAFSLEDRRTFLQALSLGAPVSTRGSSMRPSRTSAKPRPRALCVVVSDHLLAQHAGGDQKMEASPYRLQQPSLSKLLHFHLRLRPRGAQQRASFFLLIAALAQGVVQENGAPSANSVLHGLKSLLDELEVAQGPNAEGERSCRGVVTELIQQLSPE